MNHKLMTTTALLLAVGTAGLQAQATSSRRIPIQKEGPAATAPATTDTTTYSSSGTVGTTMPADTLTMMEWYTPTGTTCSSVDVSAARAVHIKTNMYDPNTMISPDSAKIVALCAVPGQIGSGEMNMANGITEYAIDIIPNKKKTHTKVIVDAQTGAVLSSKQFGGLRGLTGWVRESAEHKENVKKP